MIVVRREYTPEGFVRERVVPEETTPDRMILGVPLYRVSNVNQEDAERLLGLLPVYEEFATFETWMAPACWRSFWIMGYYLLKPEWWGMLRLAWLAGLIEAPPEAVWGPIRFRPFPWLGGKRRYRLRLQNRVP